MECGPNSILRNMSLLCYRSARAITVTGLLRVGYYEKSHLITCDTLSETARYFTDLNAVRKQAR